MSQNAVSHSVVGHWVVSIVSWRRTPWVVGVLVEGTEDVTGWRLADQLQQPSASCVLVSRLFNQYWNQIAVGLNN